MLSNSNSGVTNENDSYGHGFYIDIELGNNYHQTVFVKTHNTDMATRFLWFIRYIRSLNLDVVDTRRKLGNGNPYDIAASILRLICNDNTYTNHDAAKILYDCDSVKGNEIEKGIVDYMKKYRATPENTSDQIQIAKESLKKSEITVRVILKKRRGSSLTQKK